MSQKLFVFLFEILRSKFINETIELTIFLCRIDSSSVCILIVIFEKNLLWKIRDILHNISLIRDLRSALVKKKVENISPFPLSKPFHIEFATASAENLLESLEFRSGQIFQSKLSANYLPRLVFNPIFRRLKNWVSPQYRPRHALASWNSAGDFCNLKLFFL